MTLVMSYPYPPLPSANGELDMSHPAYSPTYTTPPAHPSQIRTAMNQDITMTARDAELTPEAHFSATNIGMGPSNIEAHQLVLPDRRRSKLGYHRTTIACGHCRKRKIRCVPAQSDLQGRCINCIRLKKECEFYPVDQPPPSEGRPAQLAKISPAPCIAPHPFPQAISRGHMAETSVHNHPFSHLGQHMSTTAAPALKPDGANLFSIDTTVSLPPSTDGAFNFGVPSVTNWLSAGANESPSLKPADLNPTWRGYPPESPVSTQFSPFGPGSASGPWTPGSSEAGSREDMSWANFPPPGRSMSYGGEPLGGHQSQYPRGLQGRQFDRRASTLSDVYTPSMGVPVPGMETSVTSGMEATGPLSAGVAPLPPFGGWNESSHAPPGPTYTYPTWGHEENVMGQSGFAESGQTGGNEPSHNPYFAPK